jgi:Esterase-like activity of phytase
LRKSVTLALVLSMALCSSFAMAEIKLIGIGTLDHSAKGANRDLSLDASNLENGMAANRLGGLGSGIAYAGGQTFLALPDRGPNALAYKGEVDNTTSFVARFHTLKVRLSEQGTDAKLPITMSVELTGTTPLFSAKPLTYAKASPSLASGTPPLNDASHYYYTGRSDNFDPQYSSLYEANGRFDPEGLRVSNDGLSVYISDEYGPYLRQFNRATGQLMRSLKLPAKLGVEKPLALGSEEIAQNRSGRTANKGMEGLAITPEGKALVGVMQAALLQDAADPATKKMIRLIHIDLTTGSTQEFAYLLTDGSGVCEILAINSHEFLLLERDGSGLGDNKPTALAKKLYRVDLNGAVDVSDLSGSAAANVALKKTLVLDVVRALDDRGIDATQIPAKLEGLTFGPDIRVKGQRLHTLLISNDNDFKPEVAGPNHLFLFGFDDTDLPRVEFQKLMSER